MKFVAVKGDEIVQERFLPCDFPDLGMRERRLAMPLGATGFRRFYLSSRRSQYEDATTKLLPFSELVRRIDQVLTARARG
ncbi:hypothetical protein QO034_11830 [Sedimentitalea sp. JM2-8]|uniref:Uncharacterized protein n=1 Tax=Sedimentitalea xiamensis TaxID=3050037 RepID=A0ABT7FF93_9RHOB|nr:hypothetical protein [Sedimentitalea xiamensis]